MVENYADYKPQPRPKKSGSTLAITLIVASIAFIVGYFFPNKDAVTTSDFLNDNKRVVYEVQDKQQPDGQIKLDMAPFWYVLDLMSQDSIYIADVSPEKLVEGAIKGMVDAVGDPYTSYFTSEENSGFKDGLEGLYEGIGAQLGFKDERLAIIAPLEGSPAEKAGVQAGDLIVAVDGESTVDWSIPKAVSMIRGEAGTTVTLTLLRGDKTLDVEIKRAKIQIPAVRVTWLDNGIAHVRVLRFGSDTNSEWDKAVNEMVMKNVKGVVLDVRNNPGGLLNSAIYLASEFFKDGVVVKRQTNRDLVEFDVDHKCRLCDVPVVVLINEGSASASEILAGAIQSRDRGKLVGVKSFGKGTVQEAIDLSGGAAIHITTAKWLLPNGKNIHGEGLTPDYNIETKVETGPFGKSDEDAQLNKAVELLTK